MNSKTAIIVGAGIGGLSSAIALARRGWNVHLVEQAQAFKELGAGIQISPNASRILQRWNILRPLEQTAFRPRALEMRWGVSGKPVFRIDIENRAQQRWAAPYLHLHRADVIQSLWQGLQAYPSATLRFATTVTQITQDQDKLVARLSGGQTLEADVLIAADGVHSTIRERLFEPTSAQFSGHIAWRAVVPIDQLRQAPPPTACVWVGGGRHAVSYRIRNGRMANFVGVVEKDRWESESWSAVGHKADALEDFSGWHPSLLELIDKAEQHHRWALLARRPLASWHQGRIALLGDACHAMLPFLAQGAAMAIEDADCLARELSHASSVEAGLQRYYQQRIERTTRIQAASQKNANRFHHANPAYYLPLWIGARLFPSLALRQFDWIYQYDGATG